MNSNIQKVIHIDGGVLINTLVILIVLFIAWAFIPVYTGMTLRAYLSGPYRNLIKIQDKLLDYRKEYGTWPSSGEGFIEKHYDSIEYLQDGALRMAFDSSEIRELGYLVSFFHADDFQGKTLNVEVIESEGKYYRSCYADDIKKHLLPIGCNKWESPSDNSWTEIK
ncbi:MAG: hypothetical protein V3V89_03065 [Gammaproteobacteria bacterium]